MAHDILLTVSGEVPTDIEHQIDIKKRPRADYLELAKGLGADLLDYTAARAATGRSGRVIEKLGGANLLLAYACWLMRKRYKAILTDGEQVGLALAGFLKFSGASQPHHLMIVHVMSVPKKTVFLDWLRVHSHIDRFLVYSSAQKKFIEDRWGIESRKVVWTPFMVDDEFFAPCQVEPIPSPRAQICAVGLERRDYPTLLRAVNGLDVDVVIAAASPWSKYKDTSLDQEIPENVSRQKFTQYELRQLYADSKFLVMPLEAVDFQAGITSILEAMAMKKAVICSAAVGQTDTIVDGKNGNYVKVGDAIALRQAIVHLLASPTEAERLGAAGRDQIEKEMNLKHYVRKLTKIIHDALEN